MSRVRRRLMSLTKLSIQQDAPAIVQERGPSPLGGRVTRNFSDPCSVFEGHADAITAIAFSPDSRYLVTACSEGTWRLFDTRSPGAGAATGGALLVCEASHDLGVQGCDFSPTTGPFTMTGESIAVFENVSYVLRLFWAITVLVRLFAQMHFILFIYLVLLLKLHIQ